MIRRAGACLAVALIGLGCAGVVRAGDWRSGSGGHGGSRHSAGHELSCSGQPAFRVYYLGARALGLDATEAELDCNRPVGGFPPTELVSYVYGDCSATSEEGCAPPLEVQSAPLCQRHPALYMDRPGHRYPHRWLRVRGVPAASFDGGTRLEIYTGRTAVVLFGSSRRVLRASRVIHAVPAYNLPTRRHRLEAFQSERHPNIAWRLPAPDRAMLNARRACG